MHSTLTLLMLLHIAAIAVVVGFVVVLCVFSGTARVARKKPAGRSLSVWRWRRREGATLRHRGHSRRRHAASASTSFGV
jgi:hypothetical protein